MDHDGPDELTYGVSREKQIRNPLREETLRSHTYTRSIHEAHACEDANKYTPGTNQLSWIRVVYVCETATNAASTIKSANFVLLFALNKSNVKSSR
jgi:hypothetical protein